MEVSRETIFRIPLGRVGKMGSRLLYGTEEEGVEGVEEVEGVEGAVRRCGGAALQWCGGAAALLVLRYVRFEV